MNKFTAFEDAALLNMHELSSTVHGVWRGSVRGRQYGDKNGRVGVGKNGEKNEDETRKSSLFHFQFLFPPSSDIFLSNFLPALLISSPLLSSNGTSVLCLWPYKVHCGSTSRTLRIARRSVENKGWCNFPLGSHLLSSLQGLSPSSAVSQKTLSQAAGGVVTAQQF